MVLQVHACVAKKMKGDGMEMKAGARSSGAKPLGDWPGSWVPPRD